MSDTEIIKQSAEVLYRDELEALDAAFPGDRPAGWRLTPKAVRAFILGDEAHGVARKVYGNDALVERSIVTLMGNQGLMLVGQPGTAKTMLSELLSAAISGDSGLTVQGTAGTTEDQIKYTWNYALLLAEGPTERALVPAPFYQGMRKGKIVRFEEITRCPPEVQDGVISILSDKQLLIAEWDVILCVDQSGSMASSVVHAAVVAGILSTLPAVRVRLLVFDTRVLDLSAHASDPVEVLMTVQLGGGTDIGLVPGFLNAIRVSSGPRGRWRRQLSSTMLRHRLRELPCPRLTGPRGKPGTD